MNKTYRINLDVGSKEPQQTNIVICSGDKGITFDIGINGVDTTNATVRIVFKKRNGEVVESPMTKVGTRYTYTTLGNETSCPGTVVADVKLTETNQRVSTTKFIFEVDQDTMNSTPIQSGAYSVSLDDAINRAIAAAELAEDAVMGAFPIANNDTTATAGYAWDARRGKAIRDAFTNLSDSFASLRDEINSLSDEVASLDNDVTTLDDILANKTGTKEYYKEITVNNQAELDSAINNIYASFQLSGANWNGVAYRMFVKVDTSGLTLEGGTNFIQGYFYGSSTSAYGTQMLMKSGQLQLRSCNNNVWTNWVTN